MANKKQTVKPVVPRCVETARVVEYGQNQFVVIRKEYPDKIVFSLYVKSGDFEKRNTKIYRQFAALGKIDWQLSIPKDYSIDKSISLEQTNQDSDYRKLIANNKPIDDIKTAIKPFVSIRDFRTQDEKHEVFLRKNILLAYPESVDATCKAGTWLIVEK